MKNFTGHILASILGAAAMTGAVFSTANNIDAFSPKRISADLTYTITLNNSNSPTLSGGEGTMIDSKGVTWEYHNAANYNDGHITLNHNGYVGISSNTNYGITGVDDLVANYSARSSGELWLLRSTDGISWNEADTLVSGEISELANNWRFIRLYNYDVDGSAIDISSISVHYSCSGISATEDIDGAKIENVITTSDNLTAERETSDLSPNSVGGEAVKFTKSGSGSTSITIAFNKTYTVGEIQDYKVEFDMKTTNINYGKTLTLMHDNSSISSTIHSDKHSSYKCENISGNWYHIEVPVTSLVSLISGYGNQDIPAKNLATKEVNAIKINAGTCVIDNLRIGSFVSELGIYNNGNSFNVGSVYWFKVSWVGKLHSCVMSFDSPIAEQVPTTDTHIKNGSPFYIMGLSSGTVTVTATVVSGYNRQVHVIQNILVVN